MASSQRLSPREVYDVCRDVYSASLSSDPDPKFPSYIGDELLTRSAMVEQYLDSQLFELLQLRNSALHHQVPSLASMAVGSIIKHLSGSPNLQTDIQTMVEGLPQAALNQVIHDVRTPYHIMRGLIDASFNREDSAANSAGIPQAYRKKEAIDAAVADFESSFQHITTRLQPASLRHYAMVTLDQFRSVVGPDFQLDSPPGEDAPNDPVSFHRRISMPENDTAMETRMHRHMLQGFPQIGWENMAISPKWTFPLLFAKDEGWIWDPMTVNFHGLSADEANDRLRAIDTIWQQRRPSPGASCCIIKTARDISYLEGSRCYFQVQLEVFDSPQHMLAETKCQPGPSGLIAGFSSQGVMMLPSTARFLEDHRVPMQMRRHMSSLAYSPTSTETRKINDNFEALRRFRRERRLFESDPTGEAAVAEVNDELFRLLRESICARLGILDPGLPAWRGYLTRRIRKFCAYESASQLADKQLVLPLVIGKRLEKYILEVVPRRYSALLPTNFAAKPLLIPVYNSAAHSPTAQFPAILPPLRDSDDDALGNLRYLVVSDRAMWQGNFPAQDLIIEMLRSLAFGSIWRGGSGHPEYSLLSLAHTISDKLEIKYGFDEEG